MWGVLRRIVGLPPKAPPAAGEVLAAPVAVRRPGEDGGPTTACAVFAPTAELRDDPVFAGRAQFRLIGVLYDGADPHDAVEAAVRDRLAGRLAEPPPRVYHLSDEYAPGSPMYAAEVELPDALREAGYDPDDFDRSLITLRFDPVTPGPTAELVVRPYDPAAVARRRLDVMLARGARFVWAELAQANYQLYAEGTASAACMVMFSPDYTVSAEDLRAWAARLYDLKHTGVEDPVLRQAVWPLEASDRTWYYHRRVRLPDEFTGGRPVYLADLWVHRPFIDGRFRQRAEAGGRPRRVPCLAETKDGGWAGIELVPFDEVDRYRQLAGRRDG
jgi:hypothetical protein